MQAFAGALPAREALIGALVSSKLHARRLLRHWRARGRLRSRASQSAILDTGVDDADSGGKDAPVKARGARLPARSPDAPLLDVHVYSVLLLLLAFSVRVWRIEDPSSVVFDELHFGSFRYAKDHSHMDVTSLCGT